MSTYMLNGRPLSDTYKNIFFAAGTVDTGRIYDKQLNVYEYKPGTNILVSLKVGDGIKAYSLLPYIFGAPVDGMTPMSMFESFIAFVASHYLTNETDPVFNAHIAHSITSQLVDSWNAAYGWGNHAESGYLKSYTETDPVWKAEKGSYSTKTQADALYKAKNYTPTWTEITNKPDIYNKSEIDSKILSINNSISAINAALAGKLSGILIVSGATAGPLTISTGGTVNVAIVFNAPMPDVNYTTTQNLIGTLAVLGTVVIQSVINKTTTGCTVVLKNNGALALNLSSAIVELIAIRTSTT